MSKPNRTQWAIAAASVMLAIGMVAYPPWRERKQLFDIPVYAQGGLVTMGSDGSMQFSFIGYKPLWDPCAPGTFEWAREDEAPAHLFAPRQLHSLSWNAWRQPDLLLLMGQELLLLLACLAAWRRAGEATRHGGAA